MDHYRTLRITLQYACNLHKVKLVSRMDVYAVVSISGGDNDSKQKTKMPPDAGGGNNPTWGFPMKFMVEEAALQQNRLLLEFKLVCRRAFGDKTIGQVCVPVKELFYCSEGERKFVSYQVRRPKGGKPKGHLTFSYQFVGKAFIGAGLPPLPAPVVAKGFGKPMMVYPMMGEGPNVVYSPATAVVVRTSGEYFLPLENGSSAGGPAVGGDCLPPGFGHALALMPVGYEGPSSWGRGV